MKRADKNHWAVLAAAVLVANAIPPVLFLRTDSIIASSCTLIIAVALFFAAYRLTCTPRWWILPVLGSPLLVLPFIVGVLFVLALAGVVPVP